MADDMLNELIERVNHAHAGQKKNKPPLESQTPKQLHLPGFDLGGFPNHLNRSSLIAPIARGRRKFHRQTIMVTRKDCVLEYTGEQLDEADGDLIMALIAYAQHFPLGTLVPIVRSTLLKMIERSRGKHDYEWLHRRIKAMTESTLFLEAKKPDGSTRYIIGKTISFHIIGNFIYDDEEETYSYVMDPRWIQIFSNNEYNTLNWQKRMQIGRGKDMAKTLQRLIATSSDSPQRYALDWLKEKMDYTGRMRDFENSVINAINELIRLAIIKKGSIENSTKNKPQLVIYI
jgi:hypothetical protein